MNPNLNRLIIDPHNNQLPVDLIAYLVEHCNGITEVRIWVMFRPEFKPFLLLLLKGSYTENNNDDDDDDDDGDDKNNNNSKDKNNNSFLHKKGLRFVAHP